MTLPPGPASVCHPITRAYTPAGRLHPMSMYAYVYVCVYSTLPPATLWRLPAAPFLASCADCSHPFCRCLFAQCCVSSGGELTFLFQVFVFFPHPVGCLLPPLPLCVLSCGFLSLLCFFSPSSLHAHRSSLHSSSGYCPPLCSSLVLATMRGVPLGGPRLCQVGAPPLHHSPPLPLSSPLPALPPSPVSRPSPYCCSPAPCALRCSSPRQGWISRALTGLSSCTLSSVL